MLNVADNIKNDFITDKKHKNIVISFPNGDHDDITNPNIVHNSMKFSESLCTRSEIKFGLCESSTFQCELVDVDNIRGKLIHVGLQTNDEYVTFEEFPTAKILTTSVQTMYRKFSPANCKSASIEIDMIDGCFSWVEDMTCQYKIIETDGDRIEVFIKDARSTNHTSEYITRPTVGMTGTLRFGLRSDIWQWAQRDEKFYISTKADQKCTVEFYDFQFIKNAKRTAWHEIPLGYFIIDSCSRQNDFSHRKLVAYGIDKYRNNFTIEKLKREYPFSTNTPYTYNPILALIASQKYNGLDNSREVAMTVEENTYQYPYEDGSGGYRSVSIQFIEGHHDIPKNAVYMMFMEKRNYSDAEIDADVNLFFSGVSYAHQEEVRNLIKQSVKGAFFGIYDKNIMDKESITFYPQFDDTSSLYRAFVPKICVGIKYGFVRQYEPNQTVIEETIEVRDASNIHLVQLDTSSVPNFNISISRKKERKSKKYVLKADNIDYRGEAEALLELNGRFGKTSRKGIFETVKASEIVGLYPKTTLYPANNLYPSGAKGYTYPTRYSKIWYDDEITKPYGRVCGEFTNKSGEQIYCYLDIASDYVGNEENYLVYDVSDNAYTKNVRFTEDEMSDLLARIASNIAEVRYMPMTLEGIGQPWIEAGDTIAVETTDGDLIKSIILSRTLSGDQFLKDSYKSS